VRCSDSAVWPWWRPVTLLVSTADEMIYCMLGSIILQILALLALINKFEVCYIRTIYCHLKQSVQSPVRASLDWYFIFYPNLTRFLLPGKSSFGYIADFGIVYLMSHNSCISLNGTISQSEHLLAPELLQIDCCSARCIVLCIDSLRAKLKLSIWY